MYLKSIEVQGFKSFANKIVFEFHNGITGIVGPNGSGKSNVADAVRWVLGEQRIRQLRGASMQDVIFSGTETRKPQGFAYVSITLDNADHQLAIDFDEVTVARRIYRSGESEYLLNGSACRLKDVNELFYDTGIGKEGYSIIGQGQIDKILSGKPEERRELFDEAAGIVKFKRRKAVAQKKLEDEKQNLSRISDIVGELERQVGPLKRQSETAREYLRLKEELKQCDVSLFLSETSQVREQLAGVAAKADIVSRDMEESRLASERLREDFDRLSDEIRLLEEQILRDQASGNEALMEAGNLEGRINVLNEQIHTEEMNAEHIRARIDAIRSEIGEKRAQRAEHVEEQAGLAGSAKQIRLRLAEAERALEAGNGRTSALEREIEEKKARLIEALNERAALSARKQRCDTMLEQVQARRSEVAQRLLKVRSDEESWGEQIREQEGERDRVGGQIAGLLDLTDGLEQELKTAVSEIARLNRNLNNTQQEYHTNYTKLESLRNLAERYEGYGNSIRRVMEVRDRVHGIHGVVADLIDVQKKYETAVETALGGSIQNIVTDSEQTAKILIDYLKKNKYGRATFLPLTSLAGRGGFDQGRALKEPGVIGLASTLVNVSAEYAELAGNLLGRVLVVDTVDNAIAIAKKYRHSIRIVTLEGELLNPGGSMTGGAFRNTSNLLGRKREMEELEALCKKALTSVDQIERELVLEEGIRDEKSADLEQARRRLQEKYLEENTVRMNLAQLSDRKAELAESSADMRLENGQLEDQTREIKEKLRAAAAEMDVLERENEGLNARIAEAGSELNGARDERDGAAVALSGVQLEAARLRQQDDFTAQNIRRIEEELSRLLEEQGSLEGGTGLSESAVEEKRRAIGELTARIGQARERASAFAETAKRGQREKEETSAKQKLFLQKREEYAERISRLDKDLFRLQGQREKIEERQETLVNYMWNEYQLTYTTAAELEGGPPAPAADMKKRVEQLKNGIRALGSVNVNAIEDYREVSERYEFLKGQYEDLLAAQEALLKIIEELDSGMRARFAEKFREIRAEFDKVFRELFGGGHGTLELVEDEDLLEAGVQIISQPPGKKLQNMMQMSGGEKALTAIALLFAIQNLKPSPFCLLDEIEAALDDSNVDRFAKYLHKLTKNTQFIVITHRRGTMVAADRLYGITMQEKGVSTLVSVNLIEGDLDK